jgi:hypothetical protein
MTQGGVAAPRLEGGMPTGEVTDVYRTLDGRAHFTFRFITSAGRQEVDILYSPVPSQGDPGLAESSRGGYRLAGSISASLAEARNAAAAWAERAWAQRPA